MPKYIDDDEPIWLRYHPKPSKNQNEAKPAPTEQSSKQKTKEIEQVWLPRVWLGFQNGFRVHPGGVAFDSGGSGSKAAAPVHAWFGLGRLGFASVGLGLLRLVWFSLGRLLFKLGFASFGLVSLRFAWFWRGGGPLEIKILSFAADQLLKIEFLIKKVSFAADQLLILVKKFKISNITADQLLLLLFFQ